MRSVSDTALILELYPPLDSGGSEITTYELYRDQGDLNTAFTPVTSFTGASMIHSMGTADGLVLGKIYTFEFRAKNIIGYSPFSEVLRVGFGKRVLAPTTVTADLTLTGPNYITITWNQVPDDNLATRGYIVEMLRGN